MAKGNILGQTEVCMLETLKTVLNMVKVDGVDIKKIHQINTKVSTSSIRKTAMVFSPGLVATFTKETTKTTKEKDTEK